MELRMRRSGAVRSIAWAVILEGVAGSVGWTSSVLADPAGTSMARPETAAPPPPSAAEPTPPVAESSSPAAPASAAAPTPPSDGSPSPAARAANGQQSATPPSSSDGSLSRHAPSLEGSPEHDSEGRQKRGRTWYGWQTLLVDGAAFGLLVLGGSMRRSGDGTNAPTVIGSLGYFFGAPSVHWAHGNVGNGFISLAIRGGSTALFIAGIVNCVEFYGRGTNGGCTLMTIGALGMIAAIPIDAAALAWENPSPEETAMGPIRRLRLSPVVGPAANPRSPSADVAVGRPRDRAIPMYGGLVLHGEF